jgi:hypothetical protein
MNIAAKLGAIAIATLASTFSHAQVSQPKAGSALRKAVLDGLRPAIEKDLKQKVIFKVETIRVYQDWALVNVHPLRPDSKPIDFRKTKYRREIEDGAFDGSSTWALLRKVKGKWTTRVFAIGPTDVVWLAWMDPPYSAPRKLFPPLG